MKTTTSSTVNNTAKATAKQSVSSFFSSLKDKATKVAETISVGHIIANTLVVKELRGDVNALRADVDGIKVTAAHTAKVAAKAADLSIANGKATHANAARITVLEAEIAKLTAAMEQQVTINNLLDERYLALEAEINGLNS